MNMHLNNEANRGLFAYLDSQETPRRRLSDFPVTKHPFLKRIRKETEHDGWVLRYVDGGAMSLHQSEFSGSFFCGRTGALDGALIRKAQLSHYKYTQRVMREMEREEFQRDINDASSFENAAGEIAKGRWDHEIAGRRHFAQAGLR